jgi:hypothetical protein
VIGGGQTTLMTFVFLIALLVLLRYISLLLLPTDQSNNKEISMVKTFTDRTRVFFGSIFETTWAIGVSGVAGHLLT